MNNTISNSKHPKNLCKHQADSLIALNPAWKWQDFAYRCRQITQQLQQEQVKSVAFWFEDASLFACTMLACFNANVRILLPPNILEENQNWIKDNADFLFDDAKFQTYGTSQTIAEEELNQELVIDKNCQTELWLKTSGSTGEPKIIVKTAEKMWQESEGIILALPFTEGNDIHLVSSVSAQHHYGLSYRVILPLAMGWTIARKQLAYPEYMIAESLTAKKAIWISSPALLTHLDLTDPKLHQCNILGILSSGGVLPEQTAQAMREKINTKTIEGYGSTETGVIGFREQAGLWTPTPITKIGVNEEGALWVESPWLPQREQTADAVEIIGNQFNLLGRIDRIVKFGEHRISLVSIEQDLIKNSFISDCYVNSHPKYNRPACWVALTTEGMEFLKHHGQVELLRQLRIYLSKTQENAGIPRFWRFTDKLPRNSLSKISRADFEVIFAKDTEADAEVALETNSNSA